MVCLHMACMACMQVKRVVRFPVLRCFVIMINVCLFLVMFECHSELPHDIGQLLKPSFTEGRVWFWIEVTLLIKFQIVVTSWIFQKVWLWVTRVRSNKHLESVHHGTHYTKATLSWLCHVWILWAYWYCVNGNGLASTEGRVLWKVR
jgi:hypothetical protein